MRSKRYTGVALLVLLFSAPVCIRLTGQGPVPSKSQQQPGATQKQRDVSSFTGTWTYRSFISNPDLTAPPANLLFGQGTLRLEAQSSGQVTGTLGGDGWQLDLKGEVTG